MRKQLTEDVFNAVKTMLSVKIKNKEIAELLGIHQITVGQIKKYSSLEEMRKARNEIRRSYAWKKEDPAEKVASLAAQIKQQLETPAEQPKEDRTAGMYQSNRIVEELKIQNEHLKSISNKLAFIVENIAKAYGIDEGGENNG